jgi:transcriptional regulator with XRE-family HTH domain
MQTFEERLGQRISRQRKAVGLTQAELAEKVSVQPETISRIETGRRTVSLGLVCLLSSALDLELHELFRLQKTNGPRDHAIERLLWFASRLTATEIELVMDIGAAVLGHTRRATESGQTNILR